MKAYPINFILKPFSHEKLIKTLDFLVIKLECFQRHEESIQVAI